jgi:hypothetical protein
MPARTLTSANEPGKRPPGAGPARCWWWRSLFLGREQRQLALIDQIDEFHQVALEPLNARLGLGEFLVDLGNGLVGHVQTLAQVDNLRLQHVDDGGVLVGRHEPDTM